MQSSVHSARSTETFPAESADPRIVLRDLFELLQDYAPTWYTEELHKRAAAALGEPVIEPTIH